MIVVKQQSTMMMMNQQQQHQQSINMKNQINQVIKFNQNNNHNLFAHHPYLISQSSDRINFQPQMAQMNRSHTIWPPHHQFPNPNFDSGFNKSLAPRSNWKGKKVNNKRRMEQKKNKLNFNSFNHPTLNESHISNRSKTLKFIPKRKFDKNNSYNHPTLNESHHSNRSKTRKFIPKRKFDDNNNNNSINMNMTANNDNRMCAPFAPRNTTSYIIRSKKSGGIAPLVSPCPLTPSILPTPILSPSRELLVDTAKAEWGVDGYGSMKGLIRLRSPVHETDGHDDDEEDNDEVGSSGSDLDEHVEVEKRLDHDLSWFEMIYQPKSGNAGGMVNNNALENRVDDQDTHIARIEEESLFLKERLFLMERELGDLRRRMMCLERTGNGGEVIDEEVVENELEYESGSRDECPSSEGNTEDFNEKNVDIEKLVESHCDKNDDTKDLESKEESNKYGDEMIIEDMDDNKTEFNEHKNVGGHVCVLENGE